MNQTIRDLYRPVFRAFAIAAAVSCIPLWAQPKPDFSRLVVVGDSLAAGFQNFSLLSTQQANGPVSLLADQLKTSVPAPLVRYPGVPNVLQLVSTTPFPVVQPAPGAPPSQPRLDPDPARPVLNLAVPGQFVYDALMKRPGPVVTPIDGLTNVVLGFPTPLLRDGPVLSQVETALTLNPTAILVWIGNNDALFAAITGNMDLLTPLEVFTPVYNLLYGTLAGANKPMIVANIPDVTDIPYFLSVEKFAASVGMELSALAPILGIEAGDLLRPGAIPVAHAILAGALPGPLPGSCAGTVPGFPQNPCVLRASDAALIRERIKGFNDVIAARAAESNALLVDINGLVSVITANGYEVKKKQTITADFLGGLFSLDGMHPTNTGYAILANEFIQAMNTRWDLKVKPVSVKNISKKDPLVPQSKGNGKDDDE